MQKIEITQWHEADANLMDFKKYTPKEYLDGNKTISVAFLISGDSNFDESYNMFIHIGFLDILQKIKEKLQENPNIVLYRDSNYKGRIDKIISFLYSKIKIKELTDNYLNEIDGLVYIGQNIDKEFLRNVRIKYPNLLIYDFDWGSLK